MSRASKPAKFDGRVLPEALPQQDPREKTAASVKAAQADAAERAHAAARRQDAAVEVQRHLTRATRDRDRTYPRPGDTGQPTKPVRPRPAGQPPTTPSSYQIRQRAQTKRAAQFRLPQTEYRALSALVTDEQHWLRLNAELSDAHAAGGALSPQTRVSAQRVDRAIRRYEQANDRDHVVYVPLALADVEELTPAEAAAWVDDAVHVGDRYTFDQFTAADHDPRKAAAQPAPVLLEIRGRRGMYLGGPTADGDTQHLLPRGLHLQVSSIDTYPDPTTGGRPVISLQVLETENP